MPFKRQKCSGGKNSKVCLTFLAACNAFEERHLMFVIEKSKNPRCFKGVKNLPCWHWSQLKSWMSSKLHSRAWMKVWCQKEENCLIIDWVIWVDWMGWVDISSAKHHLSYAANGLRDHSCFKRKMLVIRGKAIDTKLRKKRFHASCFHSVYNDVTF